MQRALTVLREVGLGYLRLGQPATELSGFGLTDDMSDTLVVAISQSGTTTDTNRTVDMVRAHLNPELAVSTIVLTMYDARTRLAAGVYISIR